MPNRFIKETVCTSENLNRLTADEEVFFMRLITACDDFGRFDARAQILLAKLYPLRLDKESTDDINRRLYALQESELIQLYVSEEKRYLQIKTWKKHQQTRAVKSKFPEPQFLITIDISGNQVLSNAPVFVSVFDIRNSDSEPNGSCKTCNGQGWYTKAAPLGNGYETKTIFVTCDCKKQKQAN